MGHIAHLLAQVGHVQLPQVETIEQQLAFFWGVKPHHQPAQGAFARAAAPDNPHALARLELEADLVQGRGVLPGVAEGHLADFQGARQLRAFQGALLWVALLGQGHQRVGAAHGQLRLLVAGDQPGDLPQRRQYPAAEHVGGHQRADTEAAGDDAVDPGNNGRHPGKLLDEQRAIGGQRREVARMAVEAGEGAVGAFPLVLALAFGAAGLEGFQAAEGFDQQRLAFGAQAQAFLHGVAQAYLDQHCKADGQRERTQRDDHQPAAEQADHHQHQHGEGQVDQAGKGHRGEEFAQALEVMDALGKTADGGGARLHRHAGDALEQGR